MTTMMALLLLAAGDLRDDVVRRLKTKISLNLRDATLAGALEVFRAATDLNFVAVEGADTSVSLTVRDVSARSALRLLLQPAGLGATYEEGAVVIRSRRSLAAPVTLRIYDVRSTLVRLQDFPGSRVELGPWRVSGVI